MKTTTPTASYFVKSFFSLVVVVAPSLMLTLIRREDERKWGMREFDLTICTKFCCPRLSATTPVPWRATESIKTTRALLTNNPLRSFDCVLEPCPCGILFSALSRTCHLASQDFPPLGLRFHHHEKSFLISILAASLRLSWGDLARWDEVGLTFNVGGVRDDVLPEPCHAMNEKDGTGNSCFVFAGYYV